MQTESLPLHFDEIVSCYGKDVFVYSYSLVGKRDDAEEISQEVFLRVFRSSHLFRGDSSFKTWLFTITRNVAQDFMRKHLDKKVILRNDFYTLECSPSAESDYFACRYKSEMCEILLTLPPIFQEVIILDVKYDRSMEEIADTLSISIGTVKSRLHRARFKMSKLLIRSGCYSEY